MKVLLLGFGKIAYMPYMHFYLDNLKNIEFELIYWDRDGKVDAEVPNTISKSYKFEKHLEEQLPFKKKLKYFWAYRRFALNVLRNNRYDRIIVLHTTPGLTLLDFLIRNYKGKYLLDFRDISYEYFTAYKKLVGVLAKKARFVFVSSNAFRKFLPQQLPIYTIHNYLEDSLNHCNIQNRHAATKPLRISYWGLVRQFGINKKMMDSLGNDPRFEIHYYGRMQQNGRDMEQYAKTKGYRNIFFHGSYMPEERYQFAANTEIIHNIYDLGYVMRNAMGNKYYDGIIFEIPQICTKGSYMGDCVAEKQVGFAVDLDSTSLADDIWNYYVSINWEGFHTACKRALSVVLEEQKTAKAVMQKFTCNVDH